MNTKAVKVSQRGEAVDGRAPMTAKQTTRRKLSEIKVFRVKALAVVGP